MKRTAIKKVGARGRANQEANKKIRAYVQEMGITTCEMRLDGCLINFALAPAHRHKRAYYKGDVDLLSDPKEWVIACQVCHDRQENDRDLTEEIFEQLR